MTTTATNIEKLLPNRAPEATLRLCSQCGVLDHIIGQEEQDGRLRDLHFVKKELRFFERAEDVNDAAVMRRLRRGKFIGPVIVVNGRKAMERLTCMDCLNQNERGRVIWGELRAQALKLERNQNEDENFYLLLVDE